MNEDKINFPHQHRPKTKKIRCVVVFQRNIDYLKCVSNILMCCGVSANYRISEMCFKKHSDIDVLWCFSGIKNIWNVFQGTQWYWCVVVFQWNKEYLKCVSRNTMILMCCGVSAEYRISEMCLKKHINIDVLWCFSGIKNIWNVFQETQWYWCIVVFQWNK